MLFETNYKHDSDKLIPEEFVTHKHVDHMAQF